MRAERVVFTLLGVVLGAAGVWVLRGDRATLGTDGASGSDTVARLTRRVAELEAEVTRPAELAVPAKLSASPERTPSVGATGPSPEDAPGAAAKETAVVDAYAQLKRAYDDTVTSTRLFKSGVRDGRALVDQLQLERLPHPDWSPLVTDNKLRYGSDDEKAMALDVLRAATSKDYLPLAQRALETSTDDAKTRDLINTVARLKDRPWSALQATGAPDTPIGGDLGTAWASAQGDMGEVTLDLTYEKAVRVDRVRVHETHAPGAIAKILAKAADGSWDVLWEGRTPAIESPTWFAPTLQTTRYTTGTIRLVVDTDRVTDWNEIDAVELEGDGIRQWAVGATASSSYADR